MITIEMVNSAVKADRALDNEMLLPEMFFT
jgi:hypothetical protein